MTAQGSKMRRYEALQDIMSVITDELVVCNIGHPSQELFAIKDRPKNFYMLGSMGLASSIALGLALSQQRQVVAIEGDAAVTMNMGTFATIARNLPANFLLVIIDNGANGSTGFQPSFTSGTLDLAAVARAAGIGTVETIHAREEIVPRLRTHLAATAGPAVLVIKTATGMPDGVKVIPLSQIEIRDRFCRAMKG